MNGISWKLTEQTEHTLTGEITFPDGSEGKVFLKYFPELAHVQGWEVEVMESSIIFRGLFAWGTSPDNAMLRLNRGIQIECIRNGLG